MKKYLLLKRMGLLYCALFVMLLLSLSRAHAQSADITIGNFNYDPAGSTYSFDIQSSCNGASFPVGTYCFVFSVDPNAFGPGIVLSNNLQYQLPDYNMNATFPSSGVLQLTVSFTGPTPHMLPGFLENMATVELPVVNFPLTAVNWNSANMQVAGGPAVSLLTYGSSPPPAALPVKLISFNVQAKDVSALLEWSTAMEENSRGFFIERSQDAAHWETIHFEASAGDGNSHTVQHYTVTDDNPYRPWTGNHIFYYRLRQQDMNGKEELVGTVQAVAFQSASGWPEYIIGPNPALQHLMITAPVSGIHSVVLADMSGRAIVSRTFGRTIQLDVSNIKRGLYVLTISSEEGSRKQQMVRLGN